jgi:hypothetical protein
MSTMTTTAPLVLGARFNGPPASANGGYACGMVAGRVAGPAEVTLRTPPPLDTPLAVERDADRGVAVHHGDVLVAHARPVERAGGVPPVRPRLADARAAMLGHPWLGMRHVLSDCFVCGPERHDGLGLSFGPLPGSPRLTAAFFVPDATLPHDGDVVAPEMTWAALDCPSYTPELWDAEHPSLLARMSAELLEPIHVGEPVIAVGWPLETQGRKHRSASALLSADGRLLAHAEALWIRLRRA